MDRKQVKESNKFWKDIIYFKSGKNKGKINEKQVLRELSDWYYVMDQIPKVYCHITGSRLSKVMYSADTVIRVANDYQKEFCEKYCSKCESCVHGKYEEEK